MSMVEITDLCKSFSTVRAVDHVSLQIEDGEMLCLLGPSGCGKTTLLRLLSGFLVPDAGKIIMDGRDVTRQPPERRPTSLVFQSYALFPHLNVFENIAFGLRIRKLSSEEIRSRVRDMLQIVDLEGLENRAIRQLSGGQQQRVALGRALVMEPKVLLLDEPLSNLDAKLRVETRAQIRSIQKRVGITSIFVTHDQEEALTMADRIAVMNAGIIEQVDSPRGIYHHPVNRFVADFIGKSNFFDARYDPVKRCCKLADGNIVLTQGQKTELEAGDYSLGLRPEYLKLADKDDQIPSGHNVLKGTVEEVMFLGEMTDYQVRVSDSIVFKTLVYGQSKPYQKGDEVFIHWDSQYGILL